ncbi:MAG: hypothetical protein HYV35_05010 [Lentisphaerae bacterium]|nr:hypothetical protein [Lentisphaerota bacterium]
MLAKHLYDKVQDDYARLRELEALRDNLMHMIVHDMRSQLMTINSSFEILLMENDRFSRDQRRIVARGQNSCDTLVEMATSLLDISRMEAGRMPLNRVLCDIRDIAQKAVDSVAVLAGEEKLAFNVTGDSASGVVDRDIIQRVFANLLGNAIKFSPQGGTIGIDISSAGETVRVTVSDQGPGIPPECRQRIFEKFWQVESREENKKYSTGLGLTFCKLAVEAHGGQIGMESQSDQGSRFWFTLPTN